MVFNVDTGTRTGAMRRPAAGFGDRPAGAIHVALSKRIFDLLFGVFAIVFFAPFLIGVAFLILVTDGGPVLFRHERVGLGGRRFGCLKFRTMCRDADRRLEDHLARDPAARAEWQATRKLKRDPRLNLAGDFLRKTSLDELPQLWNVIRGEMSIVGPRPVVADEASYYGADFEVYKSVMPGLTGLWQVSGRSDTTYDERVALDVRYVETRTLAGDILIILKTIGVILRREGAR